MNLKFLAGIALLLFAVFSSWRAYHGVLPEETSAKIVLLTLRWLFVGITWFTALWFLGVLSKKKS